MIDRYQVHNGEYKNTEVYNMQNPMHRSLAFKGYKFMFVRDPYARLWSAYLDKLYLPDFWRLHGKDITKFRPNPSDHSKTCGNDITFGEFLTYVVSSVRPVNDHWHPIYKICGPCHTDYDAVGKLESVTNDAKFILHQNGLDSIMDGYNASSHVEIELNTLIKYNFVLRQANKKECFDNVDIACRLWQVFKYNGYLRLNSECPRQYIQSHSTDASIVDDLTKLVLSEYCSRPGSKAEMQAQRQEYMHNAYRQVPVPILKEVQDMFMLDFKLFEYDPEPAGIYAGL
jgi:hypothetical protein